MTWTLHRAWRATAPYRVRIGLALTIIIGQVPKLLGIEKGEGNFFRQAWEIIEHLGDTQGRTLAVGAVSLAIVLLLRRFAPMVPGSLVAVAFGILAVVIFDLDDHGVVIVERMPGFVGARMLLDGDVVLGVAERPDVRMLGVNEFQMVVRQITPGTTVHFQVMRQGQVMRVPVTLDPRPFDPESFILQDVSHLSETSRSTQAA